MHLSLHNKAYKDILLIANGHEAYLDELSHLAENIHIIDSYVDNKNYLTSLDALKEFICKKKLNKKETKVIYASGLEGKKHIQKYLDDNFHISGNSFSDFRYLGNAYNIDTKLFTDTVMIPEKSSDYNYKYISKDYDSTGGLGIGNNISSNNIYYQKYIPGVTFSISFLADKSKISLLGFNQIFTVKNNIKYPFLYAGAMNIEFKNSLRNKIIDWVQEFTSFYQLRGFISIDFKIFENRVYLIDINPRLSGTYRIYKNKYKNLMANHIMPTETISLYNEAYHSYIILYAKSSIKIKKSINEIKNIFDVPKIGQTIEKDEPILTMNVSAQTEKELREHIKTTIKCAMEIIDCYNVDLDYE